MHRFTLRHRPARLAALGAAALLTLTGCLQADMGITLGAIYGLILIVFMFVAPGGIASLVRKYRPFRKAPVRPG